MGSVLSPSALDGTVCTLRAIKAGGEIGLKAPTGCAAAAEDLAVRATEVRTAVTDHFSAAWREKTTTYCAERLGLEMASLCVMEGRWHPQLSDDLRAALSRGPVDADRLLEVLLPAQRAFQVAVVVEGTSRLESVAALMDPAAAPLEIKPGAPMADWGYRTVDLKALAALAEAASGARRAWSGNHASGHVLLTFTVRARDLGGAALLGRRQASELLDQYMAGQRIAEIRLRPETLAHDRVSGRVLRLAEPVLGTGVVRPLINGWPPALRESLRTAHIARVTEAPMTAAGLCWAALEALEVKSDSTSRLANALSLQALRQQVVDLHKRTRIAVAATVKAAHDAHQLAQDESDRLESAAATAGGKETAVLEKKATAACATVVDRRATLKRALEAEKLLTVVDAWTRVGDDSMLHDPNRWLDVLAAPADAKPELRAAADALAALADDLGGEAGARLRTWRTLAAAPKSLAEWIENTAERFKKSLDWLYALRNTALHDGRFASATDMLDAHAGRAFVDMTLEFLGNWYTQAADPAPQGAKWTAIDVIDHLSERQQTVVAVLRRGTRAGLNCAHLTSPTSTGGDRA